jgi:6-phosphofructokinase 1
MSTGTLLVLQGGGPTPVLNASLYGMLDECRRRGVTRVIGSRHGIEGLVRESLVDLSSIGQSELNRLRLSPGASLGSTRFKPAEADMERILANLRKHDVRHLLLIGGNGSLRGADAIGRAAERIGYALNVIGVPKTIDNDIPNTDRCPGFGSGARYVAQAVRDLGMDVRALPQPVSVFETMGRGVGWLAASSALGKIDEAHAPHLVYLPEVAFDTAAFIASVDRVVTRLGWCVVVVPEGLCNAAGKPVFEESAASQRDALNRALPGGVGNYLASVVTRELKIRCRSEKPGLCARASILHVSQQDLVDAELVGRAGVKAAVEGHSGVAVSLRPVGDATPYQLLPFASMAGERHVPREWIDEASDTRVTEPFRKYLQSCVGELVDYAVPLMDAAPRL